MWFNVANSCCNRLQGLAALMALNNLECTNEGRLPKFKWGSVDHLHSSIEAMRLAFADTLAYNADPEVSQRLKPLTL